MSAMGGAGRHIPFHLHSIKSFSTSYAPSISSIAPRTSSRIRLYSTVLIHDKPRTRFRRTISFLLIAGTTFSISAYYALTYAPPILHPSILALTGKDKNKMGSHIPTDAETLTLFSPTDDVSREIDQHITQHPLALELRADPTWKESRPHLRIPEAIRSHNLTGGTLSGPGMLVVPPLYFNKHDGSEMVQIFYVGDSVSGHPGIVHGGFLATMLDEGLARCAFPAMQNKVGVTANLNINYRRPTMAGQFLVLRAQTKKVEGRKAWAEGWIESLEDGEEEEVSVNGSEQKLKRKTRLVEAEALFVEPKHAKVRTTGELDDETMAKLGLTKVEPLKSQSQTQNQSHNRP
jgi:acyl-coenzyme A thioesterase PaaI-like protein